MTEAQWPGLNSSEFGKIVKEAHYTEGQIVGYRFYVSIYTTVQYDSALCFSLLLPSIHQSIPRRTSTRSSRHTRSAMGSPTEPRRTRSSR